MPKGLQGFQKGHRSFGSQCGFQKEDTMNIGKNNPNFGKHDLESSAWKGDDVKYRGLHYWVERKLGKPDTCKNCGKSGLKGRQIHWANRSGEYKRIITDWFRLCSKCHGAYDKGLITVQKY